MFQYENITFGADPELFLRDKKTGEYTPACGLVGGTKKRPRGIGKRGHAIQEDNVMVEFNIPPARKAEQVVASVHYVMNHLVHLLPKFDLAIEAAAEFSGALLEKHPKAWVFGCDPDYNAWTILINDVPNPNTYLRTCGGHIHIGYDAPDMENQIALIRAMDLFVGVPLVVLDPDKVRKTRYGKAGAFRPKPYGVEWRVASNYWIKTPDLIRWAFNNTMKAVNYLSVEGDIVVNRLGEQIQFILNSGDEAKARILANQWGTLEGI